MSAAVLALLLLQGASAAPTPQRPPPSNQDLPAWTRAPKPEDMKQAYPPEAAKVNLAGSATLECTVTATGELADCVAGNETPAQSGFGAAALTLASKFQMPTKSPSGAPMAGRTVQFPIRWLNPTTATSPPVVVFDDVGRQGSVAFNCRVRDDHGVDNCVVVDAKPRGTSLFTPAGEAVSRARAPANAAANARVLILVEIRAR